MPDYRPMPPSAYLSAEQRASITGPTSAGNIETPAGMAGRTWGETVTLEPTLNQATPSEWQTLCDQLAEAAAALDEALRAYVHAFGPATEPAGATGHRIILWRDVARCRQSLRDVLTRYQEFRRQ